MRTRNLGSVVAAVSLLAVLVSCSDEDPGGSDNGGQPPVLPTGTGAPPGSEPNQALPHSGAPKVEAPIANTSRWEADPCSTITSEQLQSIGLQASAPQREDNPDSGPGCLWEIDSETVSMVSGNFATAGRREGLSTIYKNHQAGALTLFEVLGPIEGHPAVIADPKDERSEGACAVGVGLRDDLVYTVVMAADPSTPQGKDPCGWAAKVAALAVQTMKGSS